MIDEPLNDDPTPGGGCGFIVILFVLVSFGALIAFIW